MVIVIPRSFRKFFVLGGLAKLTANIAKGSDGLRTTARLNGDARSTAGYRNVSVSVGRHGEEPPHRGLERRCRERTDHDVSDDAAAVDEYRRRVAAHTAEGPLHVRANHGDWVRDASLAKEVANGLHGTAID